MFQMPQATSAKCLDKLQLISDFLQGRVPLEPSILIRDQELRALLAVPESRDQSVNEFIWNQSNDHANWNRNNTQNKGNTPLGSIKRLDREGLSTDEDDQDLSANNDCLDTNKPLVAENTVQEVEVVIKAARAVHVSDKLPCGACLNHLLPLVENLHPNKRVKHHGL